MPKKHILLQLDSDAQPSVFDSVVAVDSEIDHLFRHGNVVPESVQGLVHGTMFTRGADDLRHTAIFIGGSDVAKAESVMRAVMDTFFGPMRVSVMFDANGCNTTAAAVVLTAGKQLDLSKVSAAVIGATGPVGRRVVQLLASEGASVRVASRGLDRAVQVCQDIQASYPEAHLEPVACPSAAASKEVVEGTQLVIGAGAAGVELVSEEALKSSSTVQVCIDLNAVPPSGISGVEVMDHGVLRDGKTCFGAIGVGRLKMKIHKASLRKLFTSNDLVLDADAIYMLGKSV